MPQATRTRTAQPANPALTSAYLQQRLRLEQMVNTAAVQAFNQSVMDQGTGVPALLRLIQAGIAAMANLVDGYFSMKLSVAPQGLDTSKLSVSSLRSQDPAEVYAQPYAAMTIAQMHGEPQATAVQAGNAKVTKLVSTDLQLAQTHAARDWMVQAPEVTGWRRVTHGLTPCNLCSLASTRVYHKADLMPIHEHCHCTVEPVVELKPVLSPIDAAVRVGHNGIGPRLLADNWQN